VRAPLPLAVWEFADPTLGFGLLLAALPIVLYILERRRTPAVDWPAMRFFLTDLRRAIRRMRLRELLLLCIRTALLLGLALALMRPGRGIDRGIERPQGGDGNPIDGLAILLDNSISMAGRGPGDRTESRWDAARAAAIDLLGRLSAGGRAQVAVLAGKAAPLSAEPFRSREDAAGAVREATLGGGEASIPAGLDLAAQLFSTPNAPMPGPRREIYILTDMQRRSWSLEDGERWAFVLGRLARLDPPPRLVVVDLGDERPSNHAVVGLAALSPLAIAQRPVEIVARIAWWGGAPPTPLSASLSIDGAVQETRPIGRGDGMGKGDGEPSEVRFLCRFPAPGHYRIEVRTEPDGLAEDDRRLLAIEVRERIGVLIASEDRMASSGRAAGGGWPLSGAEMIALALAPESRLGSPTEMAFLPRVEGLERLEGLAEVDLEVYRAIVLAGVGAVEPRTVEVLERFVRSGGGLLIMPGERAGAAAYNTDLFRGGRGLLPCRLVEIEGDPAATGGFLSPDRLLTGHPALAELGSDARAELGKVRVRRWWRTGPLVSSSSVIAELREGVPYLVERSFGRGRVILVTTGEPVQGSDLARHPVFVPFLHGIAYRLASAGEGRRNVLWGEPLVEPLPARWAAAAVSVTGPSGLPLPARIGPSLDDEESAGGDRAARTEPVPEPGFYTLDLRGDLRGGARGEARSVLFAANIDPAESDPRRLEAAERDRLVNVYEMTVTRTIEGPREAGSTESIREEWWRPILAAVLALVALEVLIHRAGGPTIPAAGLAGPAVGPPRPARGSGSVPPARRG